MYVYVVCICVLKEMKKHFSTMILAVTTVRSSSILFSVYLAV